MRPPARWPPQAIAVLLVVVAGLFAIGVTSENDSDTHSALLVAAAVIVSLLLAELAWRCPTDSC